MQTKKYKRTNVNKQIQTPVQTNEQTNKYKQMQTNTTKIKKPNQIKSKEKQTNANKQINKENTNKCKQTNTNKQMQTNKCKTNKGKTNKCQQIKTKIIKPKQNNQMQTNKIKCKQMQIQTNTRGLNFKRPPVLAVLANKKIFKFVTPLGIYEVCAAFEVCSRSWPGPVYCNLQSRNLITQYIKIPLSGLELLTILNFFDLKFY